MSTIENDKLFKYTKEEDKVNSYTHLLGAILVLIGFIYMLFSYEGDNPLIYLGITVYSLSMGALFMASFLYHQEQDQAKRAFFKRLDHAMILIMISGTYAPICLTLASTASYIILFLVYLLSFIGMYLKLKYINVSSKISVFIYLVVGWMAIFLVKDIYVNLGAFDFYLILAGGITYSIGAVIYAFTKFKYHHALWHVIVMLAAFIFYLAILNIINI